MKKQEIFPNLNKIRDAERPFNKVVMTYDLTVRQREELIKEAHEKEQQDETGSFMCRVRRPPWMWRIKKFARNK